MISPSFLNFKTYSLCLENHIKRVIEETHKIKEINWWKIIRGLKICFHRRVHWIFTVISIKARVLDRYGILCKTHSRLNKTIHTNLLFKIHLDQNYTVVIFMLFYFISKFSLSVSYINMAFTSFTFLSLIVFLVLIIF